MERRRLITADTACDIGRKLILRYNVQCIEAAPAGADGLPTAPSSEAYRAFFEPFVYAGFEIIHIAPGSAVSACCRNAFAAANALGNIHVIDTASVSSGCALILIAAGERMKTKRPIGEIAAETAILTDRVRAGFVPDTADRLAVCGKCSGLSELLSGTVRPAPAIEAQPSDGGALIVGRKYLGNTEKVLRRFTAERFASPAKIRTERLFVTHTFKDDTLPRELAEEARRLVSFRDVTVLRAGPVSEAYAGPDALGFFYMEK